jgi:hypothetical protein
MARKRDFYHTGLDVSRSECRLGRRQGPLGLPAGSAIGCDDFYVDGNQLATGDGSMDYPYNSLEEAITASDVSMTSKKNRWFARRNRIFLMADDMDEDITLLPEKCDIIGVGSRNAGKKAGLVGTHVPITNDGCRLINVHFLGIAAANPIWTLDSTVSGIEFHGCTFDGTPGTVTSGILNTASAMLKVIGCEFYGLFATSCISFATGNALQFYIEDNVTGGATGYLPAAGIVVNAGTTLPYGGFIRHNHFRVTGKAIDDASGLCNVTNNIILSDATSDATADHNSITATLALCAGNRISCGDDNNAPYPIEGTLD